MSFNLGGFSFRKKTTFNEVKENEEKEQQQKNKANNRNRSKVTKLHPLANAITDAYCDDIGLYQPKITREQRYTYWKQLISLNKKYKKLIKGYGLDEKYLSELNEYPTIYVKCWYFISSSYWDQLYCNGLIIFFILCFFCLDRYGQEIVPILATYNTNNQLLLLPILLMLICQVIPFFGTLFFVNYCYDLITLMASREFQKWSFVCVFLCQYIQYFYYSGQGRSENAGKCRYGQKENWSKLMGSMKSMKDDVGERYCSICIRSHAQIHMEDRDGEEFGDGERMNDIEEGKNADDSEGDDNRQGIARMKHRPSSAEGGKKKSRRNSAQDRILSREKSVIVKPPPKKKVDKQTEEFDLNKLLKKKTVLGQQEAEEEAKRLAEQKAAEELEELEHPEDYVDWTCIVCNTPNHARQFSKETNVNVAFGMKGKQYKTLYAHLIWESNKAKCKRCYTVYDYVPPEATAHLFPHNPYPYVAFNNYPVIPRLQHGLDRDENSIFRAKIKSFFYGLTGHPDSKLMKNDWKLKKYVSNEFPPLLRYVLQDKEMYEIGEIVECKQQKLDFQRAKVIDTHPINNTYDIKYDLGDELRFVQARYLRLRPEKRSFAYRMELTMAVFVLYFPLGLLISLQGQFGMVFLSVMITSILLFCVKVVSCIQYCYNFYEAGVLVIIRLTAFYTLPIFLLMITSIIGMSSGSETESWTTIVALLIVTKIFSLPVIYAIRASYIIIAVILFLQSSAGLVLLANYAKTVNDPTMVTVSHTAADGTVYTKTIYYPPTLATSLLVPLIPMITLICTFKYLRRHLHNIWDVCFVIRKKIPTDDLNPFIGKTLYQKWRKYWEY